MTEVAAIVLHPADDVAVLVAAVAAGDDVAIRGACEGVRLVAGAALASGHKLALRDLAAGHEVRKYGEVIGRLIAPVAAGDHVHVHNLQSLRGHTG
ncbi:MAG: D-galactarate dehydratase [Bosea sp.]|uniref:SAF domain-containing protein n=1 Tax=Bosea sp. (in: a-proteobacteria) TaxID=1871050 RepID=UPI0023915E38|nr:D-galactarate dehydratase [Bosea sp. (in: a-proteobacteria)]MCP4740274.1 D-galactarate dehydratase [Bosea sp. (in: a-proteobacteria)]